MVKRTKIWIASITLLVVMSIVVACSSNDGEPNNKQPENESAKKTIVEANNGGDSVDYSDRIISTAPEPKRSVGNEIEDPEFQEDIPSLYEVYADYFPIGMAMGATTTTGVNGEFIKKHANMIVAGNDMKPDAIQPTEGNFTWNRSDMIVNFAKANNIDVRFHTLVWHNQTPDWFFNDLDGNPMVNETDPAQREANKELLLERLETHIRTVVERYKDDIVSWDVVNEVIEPSDPGGIRNSPWYQITGTEYIERAFHVAREVGGPDIKLYINDYSTEQAAKRDILYDLVKDMLDKGVPIDGVGHQTHINIYYPPIDDIMTSAQKFAELGLDNIITELDISMYEWNDHSDYGDDVPDDLLQLQAERYKQLFDALKEHKGLFSEVVLWGISDGHTWLHDFPVKGRTDAPLPFDKQLQAKPAYWAIVDPSKL